MVTKSTRDYGVSQLVTLVRNACEKWDPAVELAILGTDDAEEIATLIEAFVSLQCGAVSEGVFYRPGVGIVAGLRLVSGSEVVVKIHRWNVSLARLTAIQRVQAALADEGLPVPRPLATPERLGHGIATIEELRKGGGANGRDPAVRRVIAEGLRSFVSSAAPLVGEVDVGAPLMLRPAGSPLWFEPHDVRFDFEGTAAGAEWIDSLATLARERLEHVGSNVVIGHFDWRVENLGFADNAVVAIYDWDSVCAAPEAVVVGNAAAQFMTDWTVPEADPLPSVSEMRSFVSDYEFARGATFNAFERELLDAANLFLCAYGARCQHSDMTKHPEVARTAESGWYRLLRERGERAMID
jgi:hypothetical protein